MVSLDAREEPEGQEHEEIMETLVPPAPQEPQVSLVLEDHRVSLDPQ